MKEATLGFWTCNEVVKDFLVWHMPAGYVSPKQEGSNRLLAKRSCAAFYSAKITPADKLVARLYGITPEQILRAREHEDLAQFVMRGAPRCDDFTGSYDAFVYDFWQAQRLQSYLVGIGFEVSVNRVDLGMLAAPAPKKAGRKPIFSREESQERKKQRDRDAYARKNPKTLRPKSTEKPDRTNGRLEGNGCEAFL